MSFLLSIISGETLAKIGAALATAAALIGGLFAVKRSGYNQAKREQELEKLKDVQHATETRNQINADVGGLSDDDVRKRLSRDWHKPN